MFIYTDINVIKIYFNAYIYIYTCKQIGKHLNMIQMCTSETESHFVYGQDYIHI